MTRRKMANPSPLHLGLDYEEIFDLSPDIILIHDLEGKIIEANEAAVKASGYSKEELESMNLSQLTETYPGLREDLWDKMKDKEYAEFRSSHKGRDGSVYFVEVNVKLVRYRGDKVAIAVDRNITDKLQREALNAAQRVIREAIAFPPSISTR